MQRTLGTLLLLALFLIVGVAACKPRPYSLLDLTPDEVTVPNGFYQDVAWLDQSLLAMVYLPTPDTHNIETDLMILDVQSGDNYLLPDEIPRDCQETRYGRINRLPDGLLGYLWECIPHKGISRDFRLHQWNQIEQIDKELYRYPIPFWATDFSFAAEMNSWLQEQSGDGLSNKLHYLQPEKTPNRLLENSFDRVGHPSWLPDGRIIFAGTARLPESGNNLFSGLPGITGRLRQPWSIYLTDLESLLSGDVGEEQIILSDIQYIQAVKASPDGKDVAFLGTIDDNQGLWVYRLATGELARVWAGFGPYDWSPEGDRLVVLVRDPDAQVFRGHPAYIELPGSFVG